MKTRLTMAALGVAVLVLSASVQASRYAFGERESFLFRDVQAQLTQASKALDVLAVAPDDPEAREVLHAAFEELADIVSTHGAAALGPAQSARLEAVIERAAGLGALNALPGGHVIAGALTGAVGDHALARKAETGRPTQRGRQSRTNGPAVQ